MTSQSTYRTFDRGGVHPAEDKGRTADTPLVVSEPPEVVEVLVLQHIGTPARPVVEKKDEVSKGQLIAEAQGFISANVHASVSGKVKGIEQRVHAPTGRMVPAVIIENDGRERWAEGRNEPQDVDAMSCQQMVEAVQACGVVGMGGATFPTHVKLSPPPGQKITDVILNGAECEPCLTCDHRLMVERAEEIVEALRLIMRLMGVQKGYVAIEANKPDAIARFDEVLGGGGDEISVCPLEVKYPQGAEQQIIKAITGREVPSGGGLPGQVGCLVHNVATVLAIRDAITMNKPLIERPMTIGGGGVERPGNFIERIGTDVGALLKRQGGRPDANMLILGGPMMGVAQAQFDIPVIKGTSGILLETAQEPPDQRACIRCGRCVDHCPLGLMPGQLSIAAENLDWDLAKELGMLECRECGCCAYVCPAKRRIVQLVRLGKSELTRLKRRKAAGK